MRGITVLFVEDPGAVNCVAPLAERLLADGAALTLLSDGHATAILRDRGLPARPISADSAIDADARMLVVGTSENPRTRAFDLIAAARGTGIPSVAIVDSGANSELRFRGLSNSALTHAPDWLLVPDEATRRAYVELGFAAERARVVGHPNDDRVRELAAAFAARGKTAVRMEALGRDIGDRKLIVFVSEISDGLAEGEYERAPDYTLHGRGGRDLRSEIVVEELLDAVEALTADRVARPHLVLRRHPKETDADLAGLSNAFDQESRGGGPHALIFAADLVIGMTTMLLAEARLMGVPTLAVLPRISERTWLAPLRDGLIPVVTTRQALRDRLREALSGGLPGAMAPDSADGSMARIMAALEEAAR